MSKEDIFNKALADDLAKVKSESIKMGSPAHEAYLSAGYPKVRTRKHAGEIIAKYEGGSSIYPYDVYEQALAFLEALDANPEKQKPYHPPTNSLGQVIRA